MVRIAPRGASAGHFQIPPPNTAVDFYLAPGRLNLINLPSSTTSQVFQVYAAGQ